MKTTLLGKFTLALLALLVSWTSLPLAQAAPETWDATGSMSMGRIDHTATLLANGKVLVTGGSDGGPNGYGITSAELYDPATGIWTNAASMGGGRASHTATLLADGKVFVAGGRGSSSAELYDPATGIWTYIGSMSSRRGGHTATLLANGKVLVVGGYNNLIGYLGSADLYDPATGILTSTNSMSHSRGFHTATLLANGKVLVAGGVGSVSSAELYDPATETWTNTGSMRLGRSQHTATLLASGMVLVAGGGYSDSSTELYNPATGTWTNTGSMSGGRDLHTATFLANGKVLVAGGAGSLFSAELYDPATGIWTSTGAMSGGRYLHTATFLANGKVMVLGGTTSGYNHLSSAELYDPLSTFTLNLGAATQGTITGNASPYLANTNATISVTPNPGYLFIGWTGDATGTTDPLIVFMNSNKTIGANFSPDLSDTDTDGLSAYDEQVTYGTDPFKADTDDDGLSDSEELNHPGRCFTLIEGSFTHAQASADAATRRGRLASFPDANDFIRVAAKARKTTQSYLWLGLSDTATEGTWLWTDGSVTAYTRWLNGQPDGGTAENYALLMENSNQWADAAAGFVASGYLFERVGLDPLATDTDGDGLSDGVEINTHQTNPLLDDTDGDGLADGAEINTHGSNPKLADTDSDGLSDFVEVDTHGTNPTAKDTDGDGFDDLFEINTGFNPKLESSTPDALSSIRTAVEFRFNAADGVSYRIEASTDLRTWETVETGIIGTGGVVTRFYSTENQPKRFFRVKRN
jgi:uncharacterized repeat protein (TIGR02543 family)